VWFASIALLGIAEIATAPEILKAINPTYAIRFFFAHGFAAFVLLAPLAATSTAAAVRRLGFPRWKRLHRLAYFAGGLAVLHFVLRVKKDVSEPVVYGIILAALLAARLVLYLRKRAARVARIA